MSTVALIEDEVRELLRQQAIDPGSQPDEVRDVISQVVTNAEITRSRAGGPTTWSASAVSKAVFDNVAGLGPLQEYLDDDEIEEVWLNEPARVFVARRGVPELTNTILTAEQVRMLVERMLRASGRRLDLSVPFVDASLSDLSVMGFGCDRRE